MRRVKTDPCPCDENGGCVYTEPYDIEGFSRLDAAIDAARTKSKEGVNVGPCKNGIVEVNDHCENP